ISMPGASVLMGLNSPAPLESGFMSKVSLWLGPPAIHNRTQDFFLAPWAAAARASTGRKPDSDAAETPAAVHFSMSRRDRSPRSCSLMGSVSSPDEAVYGSVPVSDASSKRCSLTLLRSVANRPRRGSVVQGEVTGVQQRPHQVAVAFLGVLPGVDAGN